MHKAGSAGTEVNKAVTSYELRHSPGSNVTFFCSAKSRVLWMWCGDLPTRGLSILVSTLAIPYMIDPLLDMIGLRGVSACGSWGARTI